MAHECLHSLTNCLLMHHFGIKWVIIISLDLGPSTLDTDRKKHCLKRISTLLISILLNPLTYLNMSTFVLQWSKFNLLCALFVAFVLFIALF